MKEAMKRSKDHIRSQKKVYLFLAVLFLIGVVGGIIYFFFLSDSNLELVKNQLQEFFLSMKEAEKIAYGSSLFQSLCAQLLYVGGVFLLGISIIGFPVILFLLMVKGFIFGFSFTAILFHYGFTGIPLAMAYFLPQHILLFVIIILLSFYAISFSMKLFQNLFLKKNINLKEAMQKYLKILLLCIGMSLGYCLLETFLSPFLLQLATNLI